MGLPLPLPAQTRESPGALLAYVLDPRQVQRRLPAYLLPDTSFGGALVLLQAFVEHAGNGTPPRCEISATAAVRRGGEQGTFMLGRWVSSRRGYLASRLAGLPVRQASFAAEDTAERFSLSAALDNGRHVVDLTFQKPAGATKAGAMAGLLPSERTSTLFTRPLGLGGLLLTFSTHLSMLNRDVIQPERLELWELVRMGLMTAEEQDRPAAALYCDPLILNVTSPRLAFARG